MISLVSFTQHNYFEIRACCIVHCFLLMYSILLYGYSIHLLISIHLSSFLILTIWNKIAINIFVFEWTYTFTSPGWWNSWILWRFPGGGHGSPLHYSCLENLHGQRSLVGYSRWGRKESDMTDHLSVTEHTTHLLSIGHIFVSHRSTPSFSRAEKYFTLGRSFNGFFQPLPVDGHLVSIILLLNKIYLFTCMWLPVRKAVHICYWICCCIFYIALPSQVHPCSL